MAKELNHFQLFNAHCQPEFKHIREELKEQRDNSNAKFDSLISTLDAGFKKVDKSINGDNGDGMKTEIDRNKEAVKDLKTFKRTMTGALITFVIAFVIALIRGML